MNTTKSIKIGYSMSLTGLSERTGRPPCSPTESGDQARDRFAMFFGVIWLMVVRDVDGVVFELVEPRSPG